MRHTCNSGDTHTWTRHLRSAKCGAHDNRAKATLVINPQPLLCLAVQRKSTHVQKLFLIDRYYTGKENKA